MTSRAHSAATRRKAVPAALLAGALLIAGCSGQAGAAGFVGDTRVPDTSVQGWVHQAMADRSADAEQLTDVPGFSRQVLTVLILEPLLLTTADRLGVAVDDQVLADAVRPLVDRAGGREAYIAGLEQQGVPADYADTWLRVQGMQLVLSEALVSDIELPLAQLRAIWESDPQLSQIPFPEAAPQIRRALLAEEAGRLLQLELQATAEREGVEVSQRYGVFDIANLRVEESLPETVRPPGSFELPLPGPDLGQ